MSSNKSWLAQSLSGKLPLLSESSHELPRWRAPTSMTASIIPPPILQSTANLRPAIPSQSVIVERPDSTRTRQQELEADLQFLLDAQAEGLVRGLEGGSADDYSSTGSRTPTVHSVRAAKGKKPATRKVGLRSARRGIHRSILALSALKEEELEELQGETEKTTDTLNQIYAWESKREGLEEATQHVRSEEDTARVQRLRQEADTLQTNISQAEEQLMEMKLRHRKLMSQAAAVENSVQAKLASYTSSLRLLEDDVQKFLRSGPPSAQRASRSQSRSSNSSAQAPFLQTPVKQRTLQQAKDHYHVQNETSTRQRQSIEHEKRALDEGAALWQEATHELHAFETRLREEMTLLSTPAQPISAWDHHDDDGSDNQTSSDNSTVRLKTLLDAMETLISSLQTKISHAEDQHWNLLIAALGAEIQALEKGREILEGVLRASGETVERRRGREDGGDLVDTGVESQEATDRGQDDEIHSLDKEFRRTRVTTPSDHISDEDPDPELLFSRREPDLD